jgi:hypothetical protein
MIRKINTDYQADQNKLLAALEKANQLNEDFSKENKELKEKLANQSQPYDSDLLFNRPEYQFPVDYGVAVVKLVNHELNLWAKDCTRQYRFFGPRGEMQLVLYNDMNKIMVKQRHFYDQGIFTIADERYCRKWGLHQPSMLSLSQINELLTSKNISDDTAIQLFLQGTPEQQKSLIREIISVLIEDNNFYTTSLIRKLSSKSGVDINQTVIDSIQATKMRDEELKSRTDNESQEDEVRQIGREVDNG